MLFFNPAQFPDHHWKDGDDGGKYKSELGRKGDWIFVAFIFMNTATVSLGMRLRKTTTTTRGAKNIFVSANLVFLPKIFCQKYFKDPCYGYGAICENVIKLRRFSQLRNFGTFS